MKYPLAQPLWFKFSRRHINLPFDAEVNQTFESRSALKLHAGFFFFLFPRDDEKRQASCSLDPKSSTSTITLSNTNQIASRWTERTSKRFTIASTTHSTADTAFCYTGFVRYTTRSTPYPLLFSSSFFFFFFLTDTHTDASIHTSP